MEPVSQTPRRPVPTSVTVWLMFLALALFVQQIVGCPLAGCGSSAFALVFGLGLAIGLAAIFTHTSERRRPMA